MQKQNKQTPENIKAADTPLGPIRLDINPDSLAVRGLRAAADKVAVVKRVRKLETAKTQEGMECIDVVVPTWLQELLGPKATIELKGTGWQRQVWKLLIAIPAGSCKTYGEVAKELGRPNAARAVAKACASNKIMGLVPCHRVVGQSGPRGFAWGERWRKSLVARENS